MVTWASGSCNLRLLFLQRNSNNMQKTLSLSLLFLLIGFKTFAQAGKISGTILDAKTGETLPGATILVEELKKGTSADFDGKFIIPGIPAGKYTVVVSYVSYTNKKIIDVVVTGGNVTDVPVQLDPAASQELGEIEVVVTLNKENNTALILQQKNSASVSDGVSAETIRATPDRNTSDVLKRVSGASIQDNKFAIIRGLSDRYNAAYINGSPLPSSESDRKAFAFDIFPANMLDNLVIIKTATPDMPGEFAGGIINISTKNIPEKDFQTISLSGSYNTLTTFKPFKTYAGGKYDWMGFDDGSRALPAGIPKTSEYEQLGADEKALMARQITPGWGLSQKTALPNMNLQYSLGKNLQLFKRDFGIVFAYTYLSTFNRTQNIRREFEESATGVVLRSELTDTIFSQTVLNSALLNFSYKLNSNNQIGFKNIYSINSDDRLNVRHGARELDNDPRTFERSSNRWFTQNLLYSGQLEGTHYHEKSKLKFKWNGGYSDVNRKIPNMRRVVYHKQALQESDTTSDYFAVVQNNGTIPTAAGNMFWADTKEKIYSARYELSMPLDFKNIKNEFKIGGMQQFRDRDFSARSLGFSRYRKTSSPSAPFNSNLLLLPEEEIFAEENLGLREDGTGGFKLDEATKVSDSYSAASVMHAGFAMVDSRIFEKLRVVGGARLESYNQRFYYTESGSNIDRAIDTTVVDLLPSVNLIYSLTDKTNLRASYYRTVSRPEFRELAPFAFYNFIQDNILSGNTRLQRALIDNMDLRYEYYPGAGQVISVSGFYKKFDNPIELVMRTGTSGAAELFYTNVPSAENYGAELEYRFKLSSAFKADSSLFLDNTTLFTNLALIKSQVNVGELKGVLNRPLQGQSSFIINAGAQFIHPDKNWSTSISYNVIGPRIFIVGNLQEPDVWENSRHVIDFQFTKTFFKKLEVKLNVKDVLASDLIFYQNLSEDKKYNEDIDNLWQVNNFGQTITLGLAWRF